MSVTSGFFNSISEDRSYDAEQMSAIFDGVIRDGVLANIGTTFAVTAIEALTISVGVGRSWFNSTWLFNDAPLLIGMPQSEILLNRIDAVVIEIDHSVGVRAGSIKIISGTPASEPVRPTLLDTNFVHQYPLAYVLRRSGTTVITQADITNMVGTSECSFVTSILEVTNIDLIVAQWQSQWNDWTAQEQQEFDDWINSIKQIVGDEPVTSLAEQIYKTNHVVLVTLLATGWAGTSAPYTQTVFVNDATDDAQALVVHALEDGATPAVQLAYNKAFTIVTAGTASLGEKSATFKVYKRPVTDITIGLKGIFVNQYEPFRVLSGDTNDNIFKVTIL